MPSDARFEREELLKAGGERFTHPVEVKFQDVDAAGIVFFTRVLEYFHDAYVAFLRRLGSPLDEVLKNRAWAAPLVHAEADYLLPLRFGDRVEVALVAGRVVGSRLTVGYRIHGNDQALAVGQTVHLFVDPSSFRRIEMPAALAAAFSRLGSA